jgi:hypothetical protein
MNNDGRKPSDLTTDERIKNRLKEREEEVAKAVAAAKAGIYQV